MSIKSITKKLKRPATAHKGDFGKVITFVHSNIEERDKIASILSEVDRKIENEQATKAELEQLKKGLSQVLLTGKIRVKV